MDNRHGFLFNAGEFTRISANQSFLTDSLKLNTNTRFRLGARLYIPSEHETRFISNHLKTVFTLDHSCTCTAIGYCVINAEGVNNYVLSDNNYYFV